MDHALPPETTAALAAAHQQAAAVLPPHALARWDAAAAHLLGTAHEVAGAFAERTPEALRVFGSSGAVAWAAAAGRLATRYQDGGHVALEALELGSGLARPIRTSLLAMVARHGPESNVEAAVVVRALLAQVSRLDPVVQRALVQVLRATTGHHPQALETVVWACTDYFTKLPAADLSEFLARFQPLVRRAPTLAMNLLHESVTWRRLSDPHQRVRVLDYALELADRSPRAAFALVHAAETLYERLTDVSLPVWFRGGLDLLPELEDEAVQYYSLQSRTSLEAVRALSPAVTLEEVREVLRLYSQALTGQKVNLVTVSGGPKRQGIWTNEQTGDWLVPAVFAAPMLDHLPTKDANFGAYKVTVTHQTGHFSFGTYLFGFDRPGAVFRPLRTSLSLLGREREIFETDLDKYFAVFRHTQLAHDVFSLAEDARIDACVWDEYRGIRANYAEVQRLTVARRPNADLLPLREHMVEQLIRHCLTPDLPLRAPRMFAYRLERAIGLLHLLHAAGQGVPAPSVEDAAEAAIRLYILLRAVPNLPVDVIHAADWVEVDPAACVYDPASEDEEALLLEFARVNQPEGEGIIPPEMDTTGEPESPYHSPEPPAHHNEPNPEDMQSLLEAQQRAAQDDFDEVQRLIQKITQDMQQKDGQQDADSAVAVDPEEMPDELPWQQDPNAVPDAKALRNRSPSVMESITNDGGVVYHYDEWDFRMVGFRPSWCRLFEHKLAEGSGEFYPDTVASYPGLVQSVRRQFEMLRPQGMAPVKRLLDGEDFDLDALIESVVDRKSGNGLRDKIYWRRRDTQRSVVVSVLLDMSFSTGERVDEDIKYYSARFIADPTPGVPPELLQRSATKRIIELEKEALVLLIEALERLGDPYGIYGFSSGGRNDVRYYVLKEPNEAASPQVKARIDSIQPLQGTRIGPAVRHAARKLAAEPAQTKLLLLLTDGRPQDKDYGETTYDPHGGPVFRVPGGENEYAVHDTKAALNEARAKGITPFVVSIDKGGHDYLRQMCGDLGYEVVSNIDALPRRLPALYRRLTT